MAQLSSLDWSKASKAPRKKLYQALKNRIDNGRTTLNRFLDGAFDNASELAIDFQDRLQRGTLARRDCAKIAKHFEEVFPDEAEHLAAELHALLPDNPGSDSWNRMIDDHGRLGGLRLFNPQTMALSQRDGGTERPQIRLGEAYCLELTADAEGSALLLERHERGDWYPIALGRTDQDWLGPIMTGRNLLPWDAQTKTPIILREHTDIGLRQFVLIIADGAALSELATSIRPAQPIPEARLNAFVTSLSDQSDARLDVHCASAVFVGSI